MAQLRAYAHRHGLSLPEALDEVFQHFFTSASEASRSPKRGRIAYGLENLHFDEK